MAGFNLGSIGHLLESMTGGGAFGGGFSGDMRGIGHSLMEHYRQNYGVPGSGMVGVAPPFNPIQASPMTPPLVPAPPTTVGPPSPTMAQILELMRQHGNGQGYWGNSH